MPKFSNDPVVQQQAQRIKEIVESYDLPLREIVILLHKASGLSLDTTTLWRLMNCEHKLTFQSAEAISKLDKQGRGREWLGWGSREVLVVKQPEPAPQEPEATAAAPAFRREAAHGRGRRMDPESEGAAHRERPAKEGTPVVSIAGRDQSSSKSARRKGKGPR